MNNVLIWLFLLVCYFHMVYSRNADTSLIGVSAFQTNECYITFLLTVKNDLSILSLDNYINIFKQGQFF